VNICPYCNRSIKSDWSYCHHCNKPLLTDIASEIGDLESANDEKFISSIEDHLNFKKTLKYRESLYEQEYFDEETLFNQLNEIDKKIEKKLIQGEPIGFLILEKSSIYYKRKEYNNAVNVLKTASNEFQHDHDFLNIAVCHNEIGLIQEDLGYFDDAIYHFERAIENLKKTDKNSKLIKVYNNIANVYHLIGDIEQSYKFYDKGLQLSQQENLISEEIKTSSNLVEILFKLRNYEKIDKILNRNYDYFSHLGDLYGLLITLTKMGKLNYFLGKEYFDLSIQKLSRVIEVTNELELSAQISQETKAMLQWEPFFYLGKVYTDLNDFKTAEENFIQSLEAIRNFQIEDQYINEGIVLENLGKLFEIVGLNSKAIQYYTLAKRIYDKYGNDLKKILCVTKIAELYLNENETESIKYFEAALEGYEKLNYLKKIAEIQHKLGDLYINKGLNDLALSYFQFARDNFLELNDKLNVNLINEKINSLTI
jgi:tetratricopeptide (TPR) repeat protein